MTKSWPIFCLRVMRARVRLIHAFSGDFRCEPLSRAATEPLTVPATTVRRTRAARRLIGSALGPRRAEVVVVDRGEGRLVGVRQRHGQGTLAHEDLEGAVRMLLVDDE